MVDLPSTIDMSRIRRALAALEPSGGAESIKGSAAVAALLREADAGPEVLLIRRAERSDDPWSGHMAFPGGRKDPDDRDLYETALRETREEIGLALDTRARLLGRLSDVPAVARGKLLGMAIRPYVFEVERDGPPLAPNEEVAEVIWAPILPMFRGELDTERAYEMAGTTLRLPAFDVNGRIVWGLTHRMLTLLFDVVRRGG